MTKNLPKGSVIINVCVIPPKRIGNECVAISKSLASSKTLFSLDGETKFAHMTVFMARFAESKVPEVISVVEKAVRNIESFPCDHVGYFMTQGRYLEVSYHKSAQFLGLQEAIIRRVALFRLNPGDPYQESYFAPYTVEQQKNAKKTGYDLARKLYRPHITLTRYKEGSVPEEFPAFPQASLSFALTRIWVCRADDNGAVYERLAEFSIK